METVGGGGEGPVEPRIERGREAEGDTAEDPRSSDEDGAGRGGVGARRTDVHAETNIGWSWARARGQEYVEARLILISVHATPAGSPQPLRATLRPSRRQRQHQVWGGRRRNGAR